MYSPAVAISVETLEGEPVENAHVVCVGASEQVANGGTHGSYSCDQVGDVHMRVEARGAVAETDVHVETTDDYRADHGRCADRRRDRHA